MKLCSICIIGLFFLPAFVYSSSMDREKVLNLGVVNGKIKNNNFVEIEKNLPDTVIFDYNVTDGAGRISYLIIKDAFLDGATGNEVKIMQRNKIVNQGSFDSGIILNYKIGFFVDGDLSRVDIKPQGDDILVNVPNFNHSFSIRNTSPVILNVPRSYKGDISTSLEIEGWTDIP
ncbi:hypothetical protein HZM62_004130 [Salmonella enterica]|nr:hypothetical protein [Salmonella enterica]